MDNTDYLAKLANSNWLRDKSAVRESLDWKHRVIPELGMQALQDAGFDVERFFVASGPMELARIASDMYAYVTPHQHKAKDVTLAEKISAKAHGYTNAFSTTSWRDAQAGRITLLNTMQNANPLLAQNLLEVRISAIAKNIIAKAIAGTTARVQNAEVTIDMTGMPVHPRRAMELHAFVDANSVTLAGLASAVCSGREVITQNNWLPRLLMSTYGLFIFNYTVIFMDFPLHLNYDPRMRLHNERGPALGFRDGSRMYALHGVRMDDERFLQPNLIDARMIASQPNAEVRRTLMGIMGEEKFLEQVGAEELASDGWGTLYKFHDVLVREFGLMVKVVNATPEPDGSYKDYFIRVDPRAYNGDTMRFPQAAVASTWRRRDGSLVFANWQDYHPDQQS